MSTPAKVVLVAWSGDVSQLSARLGVCEKAMVRRMNKGEGS